MRATGKYCRAMNPTPSPSRRYVLARIARVTGDVAWWVFVVARLMVEMSSYGWTAYTPQTDRLPPELHDRVLAADVILACAIGALAIVITTAVIEGIAVGRWPAGVGTVVAPVIGAAVILAALYERSGNPFGGLQLNLVIVFVLVIVGVAIRQVWSQALAPRWSPST